jgi:O-antigen biosynthesis protein
VRGRILVVDQRTPTPDQDSGSASGFSFLSILVGAGHDVTFAPFDLNHAGRYTRNLNKLGIKTLSSAKWRSIYECVEAVAPGCDLLLLYRAPVACQLFDLARRAAPSAKILFHPVDLHFLRMERQAELVGDPAAMHAAQKMRAVELDIISRADATIVVSAHEAELLRTLLPDSVVHRIPILRETPPIGVKSLLLAKLASLAGLAGRRLKRRDILFIGGYEHLPNVDAVEWFVHEVWPLVEARGFSERLILAGSKMPDGIRALQSGQIKVRGQVQNLATLFGACRLSIAPLRFGGGIKGKIVTSLSYGVPVVATSIAAEGMGFRHEEGVLIADSPAAFADQIMRLCNDAELWRVVSSRGYEAFQSEFSITSGAHKVLSVIDGLLDDRVRDRTVR